MKVDDLILVAENRLDKDFCEHCIEKFKKDDDRQQGVIGTDKHVDLKVKKSIDLGISGKTNWKEEDDVFYKSFKEVLESYKQGMSSVSDICFGQNIEDTGYHIQETVPGGGYVWHHDSMDNRLLSIIWYLNDIHEDGYTEFFTGYKIQPEVGKIIMFPALWPWIHRGYPPKSETKYICTGWIRRMDKE
jgi:hypothetical protein